MRQWWLGLVVGALIGGATASGVWLVLGPRVPVAEAQRERQFIPDLQVQELTLLGDLDPDGRGQVRARLALQGDQMVLRLFDADGAPHLVLSAGRDGARVQLQDPTAGEPLRGIVLALDGDGPQVVVQDRHAQALLGIARGADWFGPALLFRDNQGTQYWQAP